MTKLTLAVLIIFQLSFTNSRMGDCSLKIEEVYYPECEMLKDSFIKSKDFQFDTIKGNDISLYLAKKGILFSKVNDEIFPQSGSKAKQHKFQISCPYDSNNSGFFYSAFESVEELMNHCILIRVYGESTEIFILEIRTIIFYKPDDQYDLVDWRFNFKLS